MRPPSGVRSSIRAQDKGAIAAITEESEHDVLPPTAPGALDKPARTSPWPNQAADRPCGHFPNQDAIIRLIGAILLEQNEEWAIGRARDMTRESIAPVSDTDPDRLPVVAI